MAFPRVVDRDIDRIMALPRVGNHVLLYTLHVYAMAPVGQRFVFFVVIIFFYLLIMYAYHSHDMLLTNVQYRALARRGSACPHLLAIYQTTKTHVVHPCYVRRITCTLRAWFLNLFGRVGSQVRNAMA